MDPTLALIIFAIGTVLTFLISKLLLPQFYCWGHKLQQTGVQATQNLMQLFHAFKEIVLFGIKESFANAYKLCSRQQSKTHAINTATNTLPRIVIEIIFVGFRFMPGLNRIINQLNTFKSVIPSIFRLHQEYASVESNERYLNIPSFQFDKFITFKSIYFKYLNSDRNALANCNFTIIKGESIGVIGESGSGKSTLIDLLLGLLRPTSGAILVDDKYPVHSIQWHQKIGYVPQAVYLVDDTIEVNIALGEHITDKVKFNKAIDEPQLRNLVDSLPQEGQTIVGERGVRLSDGERQRIAIARALYRNPEVLIFDEATSSLDNETEERLMETIHAISKRRTVIMIAHRLTTLKCCDRIFRIKEGCLKAHGSYKDLCILSNKMERYAKA